MQRCGYILSLITIQKMTAISVLNGHSIVPISGCILVSQIQYQVRRWKPTKNSALEILSVSPHLCTSHYYLLHPTLMMDWAANRTEIDIATCESFAPHWTSFITIHHTISIYNVLQSTIGQGATSDRRKWRFPAAGVRLPGPELCLVRRLFWFYCALS